MCTTVEHLFEQVKERSEQMFEPEEREAET